MAPQSKKKHEESFIEPFAPHDKYGEKSAAQHALDLHGHMSPEDAQKNALLKEELLKNPTKAFSKSFLQGTLDDTQDNTQDNAQDNTSGKAGTSTGDDGKATESGALVIANSASAASAASAASVVRGDWTQALAEQDSLAEYVLLVGAGHLSREVAQLAHYVGFTVDVMDMRKEYVQEDRFPHARTVRHCPNYANICETYDIGPRHSIVILSHTYETDLLVLSHVVHSEARYIGVAGTARKQEQLFAELRKKGIPSTELACVSCPIGVDIGAESPQEMAMSIVAELVAARAGRLVPHLSRRA